MCGFLVHPTETSMRIMDSLILRGPDKHATVNIKNYTLHHFRLSIVGLEVGSQPTISDKSILLFNGEIYNFREIAIDYHLSNGAYLSDTICLHELIDLIGLDKALSVIEGHYSFVIFDKDQNSIVFTRDLMGVKPLYFAVRSNDILVSSDINTLVVNEESQVDKESALEALIFGGHTGENTLYEDIYSADPNIVYNYNISEFKLNRIFKDNAVSVFQDKNINIEKVIQESIKSQSDFGVPGVCLVSSGIDSRIVKTLTQKNSNMTFVTAVSDDLGLLEDDINRDMNTIPLNVTVEDSSLRFKDKLKAYGTIPAHNNYFALCMLYEALDNRSNFNEKIKVALTGEGADEYFGGYGRYKSLAAHLDGEEVPWIEDLKLLSTNWMCLMNSRVNHDTLKWLCSLGVNLDSVISRHLNGLHNFDPQDVSISNLSKYDIQTNLRYGLQKQDVSGMLSSIEVRVPFVIQNLHRNACNGEYAKSTSKVSKTVLRKMALSLGIKQNVKIGFPVSLSKFIPDNYKPSDRVKEIFDFNVDVDFSTPEEVLNSMYMLDILIGQEC